MTRKRPWRVEDADGPGDFLESASTAVHDHDPILRLGAIAVIKDRLPDIERDAVEHAISLDLAWSTIAAELGVRRQTVHEKYGPNGRDPAPPPGRARIDRRVAYARERAWLRAAVAEAEERNRRRAAGEE